MSPANEGFGSIGHLAARFFDSLRPGGPSAGDDRWARSRLLPGEVELWARMSGPDRRHAVGVAQGVIADLGSDGQPPPSDPIVAAALLHDVGKIEAGIGTWARAGVTIVAMAIGRERVASWSPGPDTAPPADESGGGAVRRRGGPRATRVAAGRYVTHDRLGAGLLRAAGSDSLTVAWAAEHHQPPAAWTLDRRTADALKAADGD